MQLESGSATLILMRHGETAWNRERRVMGDLDIALNDDGRAQCEAAAHLLENFGVNRIVASPLRRAAESAALVAAQLGLEIESDERLVEFRFGSWQGRTYEEVGRDPGYHAFAADPVETRTPGGESAACVQKRGLEALSALRPGDTALFVTHGDIIRTLLCHLLGAPLSAYRRIRTDNGGLSAATIGAGAPEVKFLNVLADPARAQSLAHWQGKA